VRAARPDIVELADHTSAHACDDCIAHALISGVRDDLAAQPWPLPRVGRLVDPAAGAVEHTAAPTKG
jgi:hypothetical protein